MQSPCGGCGPFFSGVGRNERECDRCPNREPEEQEQQDQRRKGAPQMPAGEQHAAVEKVERREQTEREEGEQPRGMTRLSFAASSPISS